MIMYRLWVTVLLISLKSLSEKADRLTSPRSVYEDNKAIIDMAKSNLEPDQRKELDDAISSYVDIMNRRDKGEKVDEDKLADSVFYHRRSWPGWKHHRSPSLYRTKQDY